MVYIDELHSRLVSETSPKDMEVIEILDDITLIVIFDTEDEAKQPAKKRVCNATLDDPIVISDSDESETAATSSGKRTVSSSKRTVSSGTTDSTR